MATYGLRDNYQSTFYDGGTPGPCLAYPFLYAGNWAKAGTDLNANFGSSSVHDDETKDATLGYGHPGVGEPFNAFENPNQCFKRIKFEVNKVPCGGGMLVPGDTANAVREREYLAWNQDADTRIKNNFLLDLDTMHLFEGGSIGNYGRVGQAGSEYDTVPFPARGLPIKFQKVYFYGTRGQISGSESNTAADIFNDRASSDGRGALFSTYILCASTATNVIDGQGGFEGAGYNPEELNTYDLDGGSFTYLDSDDINKTGFNDFSLSKKKQYIEGIDFEWDQNGAGGTDAPLIIGDGALGFRELSIGEGIFGKVDTYLVDSASVYYEQHVTLCIDGENVGGKVLFKPDEPHLYPTYFNDYNKKMIIHNITHTFSCSGIVPTGDCERDEQCKYWGNQDTPLPFQHEKVRIFDKTNILLRTESKVVAETVSSSDKCD
jgi:hypothetical protein